MTKLTDMIIWNAFNPGCGDEGSWIQLYLSPFQWKHGSLKSSFHCLAQRYGGFPSRRWWRQRCCIWECAKPRFLLGRLNRWNTQMSGVLEGEDCGRTSRWSLNWSWSQVRIDRQKSSHLSLLGPLMGRLDNLLTSKYSAHSHHLSEILPDSSGDKLQPPTQGSKGNQRKGQLAVSGYGKHSTELDEGHHRTVFIK